MHSLFWPISDTFCAAQLVGSNILAAFMAIDSVITLGNYLILHRSAWLHHLAIRNLGRLIVDTSRALVSLKRVTEVLRVARNRCSGFLHSRAGRARRYWFRPSVSPTKKTARCWRTSRLSARRSKSWRCLAPPVRARPLWSTCCRVFTTLQRAKSSWTAWTCANTRGTTCARRLALSNREPFLFSLLHPRQHHLRHHAGVSPGRRLNRLPAPSSHP